jgi:hypothetical protein
MITFTIMRSIKEPMPQQQQTLRISELALQAEKDWPVDGTEPATMGVR